MKSKLIFNLFLMFVVISFLTVAETFVFGGQDAFAKEHKEKDSVDREWILNDWKDGTRPYSKDLKVREEWYRKKWGERWYGLRNDRRIHNPGNWKWEVAVTVPPDLAVKIASQSKKRRVWGRVWGMCFVWAPGGGPVTDIYALAGNAICHYNLISKKHSFIGQPQEGGLQDGPMNQALLRPGGTVTIDPITGRLYFIQKVNRRKIIWRYVEKLLPYQCQLSKKICYLPAVLDWKDLYRRVKSPFDGTLSPVMKGGKRADPVFVVRSNLALKKLYLPGANRGKRPLITSDGKGVYLAVRSQYGKYWDSLTLYDHTALFDIETGEMIEKLKLQGEPPKNFRSDGPGSHGGNCMGYDSLIYTCQHGGCGGGPGRMFSIDPKTGIITMLYDSMVPDGSWEKRRSPIIDGPADAVSLDFTSTMWQVQCPRTGAIINGGWDNSGIRRYHDGFVTTIVNGDETYRIPPRPGWKKAPQFYHRNSNPSIAPNGDLYIADVHSDIPRILRIYRTDWPEEQPVNGYVEKFMPKQKMEALMLDYAREYIASYEEKNKLLNRK